MEKWKEVFVGTNEEYHNKLQDEMETVKAQYDARFLNLKLD